MITSWVAWGVEVFSFYDGIESNCIYSIIQLLFDELKPSSRRKKIHSNVPYGSSETGPWPKNSFFFFFNKNISSYLLPQYCVGSLVAGKNTYKPFFFMVVSWNMSHMHKGPNRKTKKYPFAGGFFKWILIVALMGIENSHMKRFWPELPRTKIALALWKC